MGKGPSTKEQNVTKHLDYTPAGGADTGHSRQQNQGDKCVFSFSFDLSLSLNQARGISAPTDVVLVLASNGSSIDVHIAGSATGVYTGSKAGLLASCMKQNYIYEGVVTKVKHGPNRTTVSCDITGHAK